MNLHTRGIYPSYDRVDSLLPDGMRGAYIEEIVREKQVALSFAGVLKPMVATIDRYGLKRRFLKKYLVSVERFYRQISQSNLHSDTALKVKERLEKNRDKLFTFLSYDGVPWNNNNAEHAVKPFAELRQTIGVLTTEKGLRDYLVLLSLCQTCKYSGLDFWISCVRERSTSTPSPTAGADRERPFGCDP